MAELAILGGPPVRTRAFSQELPQINDTDIEAVLACLHERRLSIFSSDRIRAFEEAFAAYIGVRYAVALTSGTAALQTALAATRIGPGDEVIVPAYSYASTLNAALLQRATPVFVDIDAESCTLDGTNLGALERVLSSKTKAIIIVDLFGNPVERLQLMTFAMRHQLAVVEDCAQSTGARVHDRLVGSFGLGCHSFGEIKNMTSAEGGMLTTDDAEVARLARLMRHSGEVWRSTHLTTIGASPDRLSEMIHGIDYEIVGANFRMNALQASLGLSQLSRLNEFNGQRIAIAGAYRARLSGYPGLTMMKVSVEASAVYNRFPLLLDDRLHISRDAFLAALISEGIPAGVYYPIPFNRTLLMKASSESARSGVEVNGRSATSSESHNIFPQAERVCREHLLLPCFPGITGEEITDVLNAVEKIAEKVAVPETAARVERAATDVRAEYFGQFFSRTR